ncbi:MFS transporter [Schleiferilactobacillus harbinensis]|uniref:MFS transporter n=1 Tax=Schleiferilactobacillus harbinensis TaxID=304207 RepID=UPI0039E731F7
MTAVFIATFMTSVEVTIVTTALPSIISALHGLAMQSWIMSAYLLTTAITTPIYGKLADAWGRRRIFQWGVVGFTGGSFLSGLAPSIGWLIAARGIQGIGAGAVMPLTFTIIADYYDFSERAKVLALNNTAWGLSALVGPLIGGFLVDTLSWHWVFFVNVPLGILVAFLIQVGYREKRPASVQLTIDWPGILWLTSCLVTLLLGIQFLLRAPWLAGLLLVIAAVSLVFFGRTEKRQRDPLIAPTMFANRTFAIQIATAMILSGVLIGYQVYFPIWLQSLYRIGATEAGFVVTSSSVMWLTSSFFVGPLIARFVPKRISLVIITVLLLSYASLTLAGLHFPMWVFYVIAMINGTGMGIVISMNTILSQHMVPAAMVGSATSVLTLGRSLGQTVMTGVYGAVLNLVIRFTRGNIPFAQINGVISAKGSRVRPTLAMDQVILTSLHGVFWVVVIMLAVVWWINWRDPLHTVIDQNQAH